MVKSTIIDAPVDRVWAIVRDFNGFDRWLPAVRTSAIERHLPSDLIGCVRRLQLADGAEVREQNLTSGLQAIQRTPTGFFGGADPRREGVVMGD